MHSLEGPENADHDGRGEKEISSINRLIVLIAGLLGLLATGGGIVAIIRNAKSESKVDIFGARLSTGNVGVALVFIGLVVAYFTFKEVLKHQVNRRQPGLPPGARYSTSAPTVKGTENAQANSPATLHTASIKKVEIQDQIDNVGRQVLWAGASRLTTLSLSPDGKTCAFAGFDKDLHLLTLVSREHHAVSLHSDIVRHVMRLPTKGMILSSGDDGFIYGIDVTEKRCKLVGQHSSAVYILYYHPPSGCVLAGDKQGNILSWNLDRSPWQGKALSARQSPAPLGPITRYSGGAVFAMCARHDLALIYFAGTGGKILSFEFKSSAVREIADLAATVFSLAHDDTTNVLYAGCADGKIRCVPVEDPASLTILDGHMDAVRWLVLDKLRTVLFSSSKDRTLRAWALNKPMRSIIGNHADYVYQIALSPSGSELFSVGGDGKLILWNLESSLVCPE